MGRWIRKFILRRAGWVIFLFGFVATTTMGYFAFQLFSDLRTSLEELLPTDARSVLDLQSIQNRLESTNNLEVIVISEDRKAGKKWVDDFAAALQTVPKDVIANVEYRIDHVLNFFQSRKSLFIEQQDLRRIKRYIENRIHYETQLANPLTLIQNLTLKEPRLDFNLLQKKYSSKTDAYTRFPGGYYASSDERIHIVIAYLPAQMHGIPAAEKLRAAVDSIILKVDPKKYAPDLEVHFSGGVQDLIEEHQALIEDLTFSTIVVSLLVSLSLLIFFRSWIGTLSLILSLFIGTIWTFGLGYFEIGYLNANTAFMGSIVIGNGINFGIILLARYMEERRKRKGTPHALLIAMKRTQSATIVAASAAALSYGSLILTSFRGFRQFGMIGFTGMTLCWISAYTLLPALLMAFYRMGYLRKPLPEYRMRISSVMAKIISKASKPILVLCLLLTIFSVTMLPKVDSSLIETDLKKVRTKKSIESGSIYWSKFVDEVFRRYLSPLVVLPHDPKSVIPIQNGLKEVQAKEGAQSLIANVNSIHDFVPQDQKQKLKILRDIDELLTPKIRFMMSKKDKRLVNELLSKDSMKRFTAQELPELIKSKFRERDGTIGKLVLVEPTLSEELTKSQGLIHFVHTVRNVSDKVEPGVPVAGSLPVTSDMFESILRDGPKTTLVAFLMVFSLIVLLFREPRSIFLCAFSLILGVLWLVGIALAMGEKVNFLNFIALPITFGIGVDYGINVFQRFRQERNPDILHVIENTGGAVMLVSLTTVIGYGSLVIASNQAFVSFGTLAILGELTCLMAAVVSLPALLLNLPKRKNPKRKRRVTYGIVHKA